MKEILQKTLEVIRIVLNVLMIIMFVCSLITIIGGFLSLLPDFDFVQRFISYDGEARESVFAIAFITSFVLLQAGISLLLLKRYLDQEIKLGTPFDIDGAKSLRRTAIKIIIISFIAEIVVAVFGGIVQAVDTSISLAGFIEFDCTTMLDLGLILVLVSLILEVGANEIAALKDGKRD